jgi:hypothetical protein
MSNRDVQYPVMQYPAPAIRAHTPVPDGYDRMIMP